MTIKSRNRLFAFAIVAAPIVFLLCLVLFWKAPEKLPVAPLSTNSTNGVYSPR